MVLTENSSNYINKEAVGYLVNSGLSPENQSKVADIHEKLISKFGNNIWCPPPETLHITLMDWLAPLVDYERDKDVLFEEIRPTYSRSLEEAIAGIGSITVKFDVLHVSPGAVFSVGQDGGQLNHIRESFLNKVEELLDGTKQPPNIAHFSVARFMAEVDIEDVEAVLEECSIDIIQEINSFRLIRETKLPMQQYEVIQEYILEDKSTHY